MRIKCIFSLVRLEFAKPTCRQNFSVLFEHFCVTEFYIHLLAPFFRSISVESSQRRIQNIAIEKTSFRELDLKFSFCIHLDRRRQVLVQVLIDLTHCAQHTF